MATDAPSIAVIDSPTRDEGSYVDWPAIIAGIVLASAISLTLIAFGFAPQTTLIYKAGVVMAVCLIQSPTFRAKVFGRRRPRPPAATPTAPKANVEVSA